ncbi:MBL fold metallo-hydrolase [Arthrobacter cavernae]|uniref:MBL fold metallo-hydrolase n=1 Tax=Arthrobacter cavernae TaxID=2817681 RepID=A0A939HBS1_9MICC|nr:MBL fold metallo-hydrolase [Arthrobacter cavernae]MBO1267992.1 MBL fold metallo-hydrolase [Arthrobacter cavernae]
MCDVLSRLESSGVSRRNILASFGLGAAAVALTACADTSPEKPSASRSFGPAAAEGYRTRLVLLGTSGGPPYWPGGQREGISSALVVGDRYYLIDAGHGVMGQLRKAKLGPNYDKDLDGPLDVLAGIFLTHLHSDHVVDLNNILSEGLYNGLQSVKKIPIWGPGNRGQLPPLFGSGTPPTPVSPGNPTPGTREMTDLIVQAYATDFNDRLFDNRKPHPNQLWEAFDVPVPSEFTKSPNTDPCPEMSPFTFYEDDHVRVSATLVNHAPVFPALAYRFDTDDGSVVFSGDTGKTPNLIQLAKGADVLVHEVIDKIWPQSLFPEPRTDAQEGLYQHLIQAHTLIEDVGPIAQEAGVKSLVLSHLVPGNRPDSVWEACGKGFDGQLIIGHDLDVIGVGSAK